MSKDDDDFGDSFSIAEVTERDSHKFSVGLKVLNRYLRDIYYLLTLIGVFGAVIVYFTNEFSVIDSPDFTGLIYTPGLLVIILLFIIMLYRASLVMLKIEGPFNAASYPLIIFITLVSILLLPITILLSEFEQTLEWTTFALSGFFAIPIFSRILYWIDKIDFPIEISNRIKIGKFYLYYFVSLILFIQNIALNAVLNHTLDYIGGVEFEPNLSGVLVFAVVTFSAFLWIGSLSLLIVSTIQILQIPANSIKKYVFSKLKSLF